MSAQIIEHPKLTDAPRVAFVKAWERWTRETAQGLLDAKSFDDMTPWLAELVVCDRVFATLTNAAIEDAERGEP